MPSLVSVAYLLGLIGIAGIGVAVILYMFWPENKSKEKSASELLKKD